MVHVVARSPAIIALSLWFLILALELRLYKTERELAKRQNGELGKDRPGLSPSLPTDPKASRKSA